MATDFVQTDRRELARKKRKHAIMMATLVASIIYLIWRAFFTLPVHHGAFELSLGILLLLCESVTIVESVNLILNTRNVKIPDMPVIGAERYPEVDVLVVTHNEDPEVLFKTLNGCKYMKYPDKAKVHIHLCDDNNRPEMKKLADHLEVGYFGFNGNTTAKAGNLNYALSRTHSSHVAIFDADMIPTSDFLMETVPYFFLPEMIKDGGQWRERRPAERLRQKPIGYVQTRQSFYNLDMLQRNLYLDQNAPSDLDFFYREVNVYRMWSNSVAFGGSNTVFARQALDDAGGIRWSITEDMATSIEILEKGYRVIGLDKELAHGLAPDNAFSFITQRQRWSRGSAHDLTSWRFLGSSLPFLTKLGFFSSYLYWWAFFRRFVYLLCPILWGLFGVTVAEMSPLMFLAVWGPYALLYSMSVRIISDGTQSMTWSSIVDTVQMPYLLGSVVIGTLKLPGSTFKVTPKNRAQGRNSSFYLAIPHILLTVVSLIAIVFCCIQLFVYHSVGSLVPLFWLVFNLYALIYSIVYYWGRSNSRFFERVFVSLPVTVRDGDRVFTGMAADISEGGVALLLDTPLYLPYDSDFDVQIRDRDYQAILRARVCQVQQVGERWKYSLTFTSTPEKDMREYYQILYDRNHTLPRAVDMHLVSDVKRVAKGLTAQPRRGERRLPRIAVKLEAQTDRAGTVEIIDFNYKYLTIRKRDGLPRAFKIRLEGGLVFDCVLVGAHDGGKGGGDPLYEMRNWRENAGRPELHELIVRHRRGQTAAEALAEAEVEMIEVEVDTVEGELEEIELGPGHG